VKKVLLVDDTETVLLFEKILFRGFGFEVSMARNGLQALEAVKESEPDLIILDIMMPELNGIETCQRLKSDPNTQHVPIFMMTTRGEENMVEEAYAAGCDEYLTKPIDKFELLAKLGKLKKQQREEATYVMHSEPMVSVG
jgi:CheY-like chemotaxis protein